MLLQIAIIKITGVKKKLNTAISKITEAKFPRFCVLFKIYKNRLPKLYHKTKK